MARKGNIMASDTDRSDRLAAALRANLQRRKAQARARRTPLEENPSPAATGGNPATGGSSAPSEGKPAIVPDGEAG
ncbi:hypothetical protein [Xanthobacter flavus]